MSYVFGHSGRELERLAAQAALVEPVTRDILVGAGIAPGMRVLDVGSGIGDVAFLVSALVGESGSVVGVDRAEAAVAEARRRGEAGGMRNVSFEVGDPAELAFEAPFDAVVGRYVLQFQPDPAEMLRRLGGHLRPGGIVAFHELDWTGFRSVPEVASWERLCRLIVAAVEAGGATTRMGGELPSVFAQAGLPAPKVHMTALVGAGANSREVVARAVRVALTLRSPQDAPDLLRADDPDGEQLIERILEEAAAGGSFVIGPSELGASSRV
ncbi:MAG TPA: methyltransferase domain-containing protein [Gaiellaceae bacterium]